MEGFFGRLKERKLVQWMLAYAAAAFALLQGVDIVAQRFSWPESIERGLIVVLAVGFFVTIVLAWFHGERGAQRVTGTELLILALLLAIGGGLLWRMEKVPQNAAATDSAKPAATLPMAIPDKSIAVLPLIDQKTLHQSGHSSAGELDARHLYVSASTLDLNTPGSAGCALRKPPAATVWGSLAAARQPLRLIQVEADLILANRFDVYGGFSH